MAKATTDTVQKTVETEIEETTYVLTLSEEEAKTLFALTGAVTGIPADTYRRDVVAIRKALGAAKLPYIYRDERFGYANIAALNLSSF